jgi:nucleoid-associated protein YgaU
MKFTKLVAASLLAVASVPAALQAQDAPELNVGGKVYGPEGNEVGTIEKVEGGNVTLNTGSNVAVLPSSSFGFGVEGPAIGYTKAQLDAAVEAANAQAQAQAQAEAEAAAAAAAEQAKAEAEARLAAAFVEGASLRSIDGVSFGMVETIAADGQVTVNRDGTSFMLTKDVFDADDQGLVVRYTAEQLEAAIASAVG